MGRDLEPGPIREPTPARAVRSHGALPAFGAVVHPPVSVPPLLAFVPSGVGTDPASTPLGFLALAVGLALSFLAPIAVAVLSIVDGERTRPTIEEPTERRAAHAVDRPNHTRRDGRAHPDRSDR